MGRVADRHEEPLASVDEADDVLEIWEAFSWEEWMGLRLRSMVWVEQQV